MPTPSKPADRRSHRGNAPKNLVVLPVTERPVPPADPDWLPITAERWNDYWTSPVAKAAHEVDLDLAELTFSTFDEIRRCRQAAKGKRLVEGSTGQPRLNPLLDRADKLAAQMPRLWTELGLTPKARAALALNVGQAQKTIEDLNREADATDDADDYDGISTLVEPGETVADEG